MKATVTKTTVIKKDGKGGRTGFSGKRAAVLTITLIIAIGTVSALVFLLPGLINSGNGGKGSGEEKYQFAKIDPNENIYEDRIWLDLDRRCFFEDGSSGFSVSIDEELSDVPSGCRPAVACLLKFIEAAVAGDARDVNALFSQKYYDNGGEGKAPFTPQKLYDVKFTFVSEESVEENGISCPCWVFWIEYKIKDNNGTFRNDMGSDASRKEYVVLCQRGDSVSIDTLTPFKTK